MPWQFFTNSGKEKIAEDETNQIGLIAPYAGASAPTGWLLCDGSSLSKTTYPALASAIGTTYGAWTPNVSGYGVYASDSTITRVTGYGWDQSVYSTEGYGAGVYATAKAGATNLYSMFGLNTDPTTDGSYSSIDYAWYLIGNGTLAIYENGSVVGYEGAYGAYTTSTVLRVQYDGTNVTYLKDGAVQRTVARAPTTFYFDSSFYLDGLCLTAVDFGTTTAADQKFKLPDLRGRTPTGTAQGYGDRTDTNGVLSGTGVITGGSTIAATALGYWQGAETVVLSEAQSGIVAHSHGISSGIHNHGVTIAGNGNHAHGVGYSVTNYKTGGTTMYQPNENGAYSHQMGTTTVATTGSSTVGTTSGISINDKTSESGSAHTNVMPGLALNYIIKY